MDFNFNKKYELFNEGWEFTLSKDFSFEELMNQNLKWEKVSLPHDWSIFLPFDMKSPARNEGGLLNGGFGYYKKTFILEKLPINKQILLSFDGIYMDSDVFVNGIFVGNYPFGYNEVTYDITDYLRALDNTIIVKVSHRQPSSRWYSGSGIYRDVSIITKDKLNFKHNETVVKSNFELGDVVDLYDLKNARIDVKTIIQNVYSKERKVSVLYKLFENSGKLIQEEKVSDELLMDAFSKKELEFTFNVVNPKLWDIDSPINYYLKLVLSNGEKIIDEEIIRFGIRKIDFDNENGFFLNGKNIKLQGVCLHHDNGALGAISNKEAEERKLRLLKEMGVNAIRTSHNPQSKSFIRLCDEMGLLVIEEMFDTWSGKPKKEYDYNRFFKKMATHKDASKESYAEFDLKTMIKRDINSPSIIMWSMGNEIWETKEEYGLEIAKNLIRWTKEIDDTRYVTIGENAFINGYEEGITSKIMDLFDVVGLNYGERSIEGIEKNKNDWKIYGAETSSSLKSRGIYYNPQIKDNIATGSVDKHLRHYQMSDYGNDRVGWGRTAINSYIPDRDSKKYAGQFIWTGFDYIGEPTPWHNEENIGAHTKSSYFGILDTCGFKKNDYYFYQSQWINKEKKPVVKILPHWNFDDINLLKEYGTDLKRDDNFIPVRVYSNLQNVELFLNGESLGLKSFKKKKTHFSKEYLEGENPDELYLQWLVPFKEGKLEARGNDGNIIYSDVVKTSKKPYKVKLNQLEKSIKNRISYVGFDILDENDVLVPYGDNEVFFKIEGGEILGVDNGNAASFESYKGNEGSEGSKGIFKRKAFSGKGIVIFKSLEESVKLEAISKELVGDTLEINSLKEVTSVEDELKDFNFLENNQCYFNEKNEGRCDIKHFKTPSISSYKNYRVNLPKTVIGIDDLGFEHELKVTWDDVKKIEELNKKVGIYEISGLASSNKVNTIFRVEDFVSAKNFSIAMISNQEIKLPKESTIYSTSGEKKIVKVLKWIRKKDNLYEGILEGTDLTSLLTFREVTDTSLSYNYALFWNGSEIPAAFSSYTDESRSNISALNNGIVNLNRNSGDIWCNSSDELRKEDFVGIIFARGGQMEKHSITDIRVIFYNDEEFKIPMNFEDIDLQYFINDDLKLPKDYSNVENTSDLSNDSNWKSFGYEAKINGSTMDFKFENINTLAFRIVFRNLNCKIAISEIESFGRLPISSSNEAIEINYFDEDDSIFKSIDLDKDIVIRTENFEVKPKEFGSYTIVENAKCGGIHKVIAFDEAQSKESFYYIDTRGEVRDGH